MNAPRFYSRALHPGEVTLDEAEARHARASRRLRPGDELELFDGRGRVGFGRIVAENAPSRGHLATRTDGRDAVTVHVERILLTQPPIRTLTLIVPGCKGERLEWMVEKCTELGASRLEFAAFQRSVVSPGETRIDKLRRVAIEACKQSRRAWLPEIAAGAALPDLLHEPRRGALLLADPDETAQPLAGWLHAHAVQANPLTVVIGPEGGLAAEELEMLRGAGAQIVRLAEHILRIETAAVCAAANWAARGDV